MTGVGEAGVGVDDDDKDSGEAIPPERAQGGREGRRRAHQPWLG